MTTLNKVVRVAIDPNGRIGTRLRRLPGVWLWEPTSIDSILAHVERELGIGRMEIYKLARMNTESVSRARSGKQPIQHDWLARLSDLSGIPYDELIWVGNVPLTRRPHPRSRKKIRKEYEYLKQGEEHDAGAHADQHDRRGKKRSREGEHTRFDAMGRLRGRPDTTG